MKIRANVSFGKSALSVYGEAEGKFTSWMAGNQCRLVKKIACATPTNSIVAHRGQLFGKHSRQATSL